MYSLNSTKTCMKLINSNPSQISQKTRSKMLSTASRQVKQKTAVEYELNGSKIAVTRQRKIRKIFNESIRQEDCTPKSWRKIRIQVIYKKGDREDAGNYRPICSLPVLYKLFATVLYARLASSLHKNSTTRQRWVSAQPPYRRPSDGVVESGVYRCTSLQ